MNQTRLNEICKDELFIKTLFEIETPNGIQKVLSEKDILVTLDEAEQIKKSLCELNNNELSQDSLEQVSGGNYFNIFTAGVLVGEIIGNVINNARK